MRRSTLLFLCLLTLIGCADQGSTPLTTASKPAPAPANLTPEQKQAYDAAVAKSQPPSKP